MNWGKGEDMEEGCSESMIEKEKKGLLGKGKMESRGHNRTG